MSVSFASRSGLLVLPLLLFLQGCGFWVRSGESGPQNPPPNGPPPTAGQNGTVTITPMYLALAPGQKFKFTATASNGGQIEWLVNGTAGGGGANGPRRPRAGLTAPAPIPAKEKNTLH